MKGQQQLLYNARVGTAHSGSCCFAGPTLSFTPDGKLRIAPRREGGYLLLSNIVGDEPGHLWWLYLLLPEIDIDQTWRLSEFKGWRVWGNARKQGAAEWQGCRTGGFEFGDCRRVRGDEFVEGP